MTARPLLGRDLTKLLADFGHDLPTTPHRPRRLVSHGCTGARHDAAPDRPVAGWAASPAAPVATWRMTSDQAPVLWPFIATPGLPPRAPDGHRRPVRGSFRADPFGWVLRDEVPVTNPMSSASAAVPRQVRQHQGVDPADDGLRLPLTDSGRPQGQERSWSVRGRLTMASDSAGGDQVGAGAGGELGRGGGSAATIREDRSAGMSAYRGW